MSTANKSWALTNSRLVLMDTAAKEIHLALVSCIDSIQYSLEKVHAEVFDTDMVVLSVKSVGMILKGFGILDSVHCICPLNCIHALFSPVYSLY